MSRTVPTTTNSSNMRNSARACLIILLTQLVTSAGGTHANVHAPRPHIISIIQDDLGWYDSGIHNADAVPWTRNITALADSGIVLERHYTHYHCSPSRRAFITGRLPIFHSEGLSDPTADHIDLRMQWVSDKLAGVGYSCYWFGKMHTGFRSIWVRLAGWQHACPKRQENTHT